MKLTFQKSTMVSRKSGFTPTVKFRIIAAAAIKRCTTVLLNGVSEIKNTLFSQKAAMRNSTAGFTLIETLVAVMILVFAIIGPFALAAQSLRAAHDARAELFSTYLALEALEITHSIRDNNSADDVTVNHTSWMNNITSICAPTCVPDITQQTTPNVWRTASPLPLITCATLASNCALIYYNPNTGLYRQGFASAPGAPWSATTYRRLLSATVVDATRQVRMTSTVTYLGYGRKTRTVSIDENIYNWFPKLIP